jgi:thiamine kinase-like enzyme
VLQPNAMIDPVASEVREWLAQLPAFRNGALSIFPLPGGLTNRNFRVDSAAGTFVARVSGEQTHSLGIDRAQEIACTMAAAALGVAPEVVAFDPEHGFLVRRFVPGRVLEPADVRTPARLERVTGSLRRLHRTGAGGGRFSAFEVIRAYHRLACDRRVALPGQLAAALRILNALERVLQAEGLPVPCHNDLLPANLIDDEHCVRIIDWEYAGMGDPFFDLANLAANCEFGASDECALLSCYFGEAHASHLLRLRRMRLVSDLREAMWGFVQVGISTLPVDYVEYGQRHLRRFFDQLQHCDLAACT